MSIKKTIAAILCAAAFMSLSGCDSQDYNAAMELMVNKQWAEASEMFASLEGYKDSAALMAECDYNIALAAMDNGEYEDAIAKFEALNGYSDSADKITECSYMIASGLFDAGEYEKAIEAFTALGDYEDSADKVTECTYLNAKALFDAGNFQEALPIFESLVDYEDSQRCITVCRMATEHKRFIKELVKDMGVIFDDNDFNYDIRDVSELTNTGEICYCVIGKECSNKVLIAFPSIDSEWEKVENGQPNSIIIIASDITEEEIEYAFAEVMIASGAALAALDAGCDTEETVLKVIDEFDEVATAEVSEIDEYYSASESEFSQNGFECFVEVSDVISPEGVGLYGFYFGIMIPELCAE